MNRRGMTLVEVLLVAGVLTILSAILGPLFVKMLGDLNEANRLVQEASIINKLVQSMREDIGQARSVEMVSDHAGVEEALRIELPDQTVVYRFEGDRWVRRRWDPDSAARSEGSELNAWVLPSPSVKCRPRWNAGQVIAVEIQTGVVQTGPPDARRRLANSHVLFVGAAGDGR